MELALIAGYSGDAQAMLQALQSTGFMDEMKIHEWEEHNGYHSTFAERAKTAAAARWAKKKAPKQKKKGEEKKGEEKRQALLVCALSNATSMQWRTDEAFSLKMKEWIDYRIMGDRPKDGDWEKFFTRQIKFLSDYPCESACEIIDISLRNGWTGLFPLKGLSPQSPKSTAAAAPTGAYDAPSLI